MSLKLLCFPCLLLLFVCGGLSDALKSWLRGISACFVVFGICLAPERQGGHQCSSQGRGGGGGGGLWQQLAVGLQLAGGMKRGRHLNSDKPSLSLEVSQVTCFCSLPSSLPYMTQDLFARCPGIS